LLLLLAQEQLNKRNTEKIDNTLNKFFIIIPSVVEYLH